MTHISKKTYLQNQIKLMALNTYDLFTDEELACYRTILKCKAELDRLEKQRSDDRLKAYKKELIALKKQAGKDLNRLIAQNKGAVRRVNTASVCDSNSYVDNSPPSYISWDNLKFTRKITEFISEQSRAMGLKPDDVTLDKIILSWRSLDVLEQIVLNGFTADVMTESGDIVTKHYHFRTASAGQLRTDRVQILSDDMWDKIKVQMQCGIDWEELNKHGGINVNKLMAYEALNSSATDVWDFPIDKCIVVRDFEAPVTGLMDYIKPGYELERGVRTVMINHCDGCGIALPGTLPALNTMVRGPWIKGLLSTFDYMAFCRERGAPPVIEDVWGQTHNLVLEDICVIFTESQLKLWKYYDSWEHYKSCFKKCGCHLCCTNYEEDYVDDTTINYQMLQTLIDMTDEEIEEFTRKTKQKISSLATNKQAMLRTLGADASSDNPYLAALAIFPELLRDGYAKETIKNIKRRMLLDAKSGSIVCENKRLFAIPDLYAACEFWFLGEENPNGLIPDGYVCSVLDDPGEEIDVLRSPHLYFEHAIRKVYSDEKTRKWFRTKGIYTSCHDLISRILQFDKLMSPCGAIRIE